jgi:hypothetical protein
MKKLLIAALAFSLTACGSDSTSPTVGLTGDFALRTVNGQSLPYTFSDGSTITSDVLTFFNDGTFSESIQLSTGQVFVDQGEYSDSNGSITLFDETIGVQYSASLSGSVLTAFFQNGLTEVFQKT